MTERMFAIVVSIGTFVYCILFYLDLLLFVMQTFSINLNNVYSVGTKVRSCLIENCYIEVFFTQTSEI